ncbi:MAG: TIGR01906 family membrane protein [Bacillota bacterium]|nr:TIGR01906 family membrane protein [Bacillota bacterium]
MSRQPRLVRLLPGILAGFAACLVILISAVAWAAFDRGFYRRQYAELDTAADIGITAAELEAGTTVLLDYLAGHRDDLGIEVRRNGRPQPLFNSRETEHMLDVRELYRTALAVRRAAVAVIVLMCGTVFFVHRKVRPALRQIARGAVPGMALFLASVALVALWAVVDFSGFWTRFHLIFFRNDLWLLDPATDMLIRMVPEPFFAALVRRIVLAAAGGILLLWGLAFCVSRRGRRREPARLR